MNIPKCVVCNDAGCEFCPRVVVDGEGGATLDYLHAWPLRVDALESEARKAEGFDRLARTLDGEPPVWVDGADRMLEDVGRPSCDEWGSVEPRVVAALAGVAVVALVLALLWRYAVGAAVVWAAWRHVTRGSRRRRPRSSWSSLGRTAALLYAAWNSRWLRPTSHEGRWV